MAKRHAKSLRPTGRRLRTSQLLEREEVTSGERKLFSKAFEDTLEDERARLMKAHSVLGCVAIALEEAVDLAARSHAYYPDVIELARELVSQTIERLDSVHQL